MARPDILYRSRSLSIWVFGLALLSMLSPSAFAQQGSLIVSVDREAISLQQTVSVTVVAEIPGVMSQARLIEPSWNSSGWRVMSRSQMTQVNITNGSRSLEMTYTYQLKPNQLGDLTIGPFKGEGTARGLTSNVVTIKVTEQPPPKSKEAQSREELYARTMWNVDRQEVWLGERIEASLSVYVNSQLRLVDITVPDIDLQGFWAEELEVPRRSPRVELNNNIYGQTMIKRDLLTPLKSGDLTLPEISMELVIGTMSIFSERQAMNVTTPRLTVKVKALPPNPPAGFKGPAVGEVRLESSIDRNRLREGDGAQLTIKTTTTGLMANTPAIELPYIDGIKTFPPTTRTTRQEIAGKLREVRIQTWLIRPERVGRFQIPMAQLPYFDPRRGVYDTAQSRVLNFTVQSKQGDTPALTPSQSGQQASPDAQKDTTIASVQAHAQPSATERLGVQLHSILTNPIDQSSSGIPPLVWWLIGLIGPLALLFTEGRQLIVVWSSRGAAGREVARAGREAQRKLKELDERDFNYALLDEIIAQYLESRFQRQFRGHTREQACIELSQAGLSDPLVESYRGLLEEADFARFAPRSNTNQGAQVKRLALEWLKLCEQQLEEVSKSKTAPASLGVLLLLSLSFAHPAHAEDAVVSQEAVSAWASAGNDAFWSGDYLRAIQLYQEELKERPMDAGLWFNLGTAQAHHGRLGEAAYALERAVQLAPHDEAVLTQRERVHQAVVEDGTRDPGGRRLVLPDEVSNSGGLLALLEQDTLRALTLATLSLACLLFVSLRRSREEKLSSAKRGATLRALCLVATIACLLSGGMWWLKLQNSKRVQGVVVSNRASLYKGPGEQYPVEVNVAGAVKLELQGVREQWRRVRLSDGREGWLKQDEVRQLP